MPTPVRRARPRLGELLVELGALEPSQLEAVLEQQRQWGMSFGRAAIACGYCTEFEILAALTKQTGLRGVDLEKEEQAPEVQGLLPLEAAKEHRAVALRLSAHTLMVAMAAPASLASQDAIRTLTGRARLDVLIASDEAIDRAIHRFYALPWYEQPEAATQQHRALEISRPTPLPRPAPPPSPMKRPELFDLLSLTPQTGDIVLRMCQAHNLSHRELLGRVVEQWAANLMKTRSRR
jgi:hypothetical protein